MAMSFRLLLNLLLQSVNFIVQLLISFRNFIRKVATLEQFELMNLELQGVKLPADGLQAHINGAVAGCFTSLFLVEVCVGTPCRLLLAANHFSAFLKLVREICLSALCLLQLHKNNKRLIALKNAWCP